MKRLLAFTTLVIMLIPNLNFAEENDQTYLCTDDKVTGFNYNKENKTLVTAKFHANKFILNKWPSDGSLPINWEFTGKEVSWSVWDSEKKGLRLGCIENEKEIYCSYSHLMSYYFRMDKDTLRFVMSKSGNYTLDIEVEGSTMISAGTCSGF